MPTSSSTTTAPPRVPGQRKKRFRREPEGRLQITERDLAILRHVFRHRFLRSTHLQALVGGGQKLLRRLAELYHHGFLDRPREPIEFYAHAGSKPMVYALGNQGANLLRDHCGLPRGQVDWAEKNRGIGPLFLDHTLLVADIMVAFELACPASGRERVRFLDRDELLSRAPEATQGRKRPFEWAVACRYLEEPVTLGVAPDALFGLHFLDRPEGRNRAYFFLEADRATMPIERRNVRQTSFFRKMTAYYETWKQGIHTEVYGIQNFRVLTVTSSPERVETMIRANRNLAGGKGSRLFLFTDAGSFRAAPDLLAHEWWSGEGEKVKLVG